MNLFIVKRGAFPATASDLLSALEQDAMRERFADGFRSEQWQSPCSTLAFACMHEGPERAAPRRYLHNDGATLATFDGLPVDTRRRFDAHDASQIASNWQSLDADVDGFYCAVKIDKGGRRLEVQTDLFGVYKVYTWTDGKSCLVSNSVEAIDSLVQGIAYDHAATGMFISMAWAPGRYTLLDGVESLGPAERLVWDGDNSQPAVERTIATRDLFSYPSRPVGDEMIDDLSEQLVRTCEGLGSDFPNILCPLTGGKDSRLLAVLLCEAGVPARAYTYGNTLGTDAQIASEVARVLGIGHESILTSTQDLLAQWDEVTQDFVRRSAGLCPLQLVTGQFTAAIVDEPSKPIRLWGAGSSICRGPYFYPPDYVRKADVSRMKRRLTLLMVRDYGGLVRPEVVAAARAYVDEELDRYEGEGVRPLDLPDVFWIHERGSARSGKNMRSSMNRRDTYSPFFGRAFATASFALSAMQRATEPLHYRVLEKLAPQLRDVPFDKGKWKPQNKYLNFADEFAEVLGQRARHLLAKRLPGGRPKQPQHMLAKDTMFERVSWLKRIVGDMREQFSDPSNADLRELVDTDVFMKLTSASVTDATLARHIVPLFTIGTILTYRNSRSSRGHHVH